MAVREPLNLPISRSSICDYEGGHHHVGAIPQSPPSGTPAGQLIEYYSAIKFLPLNADDRFVVATNMATRLDTAGNEVEYAEARAEAAFWAHVRDWTKSLDDS
jgi:hypothetical protein